MKAKEGILFTEGSILKHLISFAVPMAIGYTLYMGYSIINTLWIGNLLGEQALAASSVSFILTNVLMSLVSGITLATSILIARYYGEGNSENVTKTVVNSYYLMILLDVIVLVVGIWKSTYFLKLLGTPPEILGIALQYFRISVFSFVFMYLFFLLNAMLRGIGDSRTSMYFMGISVVINAILDPFLIAGTGFGNFKGIGLNGAAYASLLAQGFSSLFLIFYVHTKNKTFHIKLKQFRIHLKTINKILKVGIPNVLQQLFFSIGITFVSSYLIAFGVQTIAAFGAASKLDIIASILALSIGSAVTTITAQNLGANRPERVNEVFKYGMRSAVTVALIMGIIIFCFPAAILSLFLNERPAINIGICYLRIISLSYCAVLVTSVIQGIFNGTGKTIIAMASSIISLWAVRIPLSGILSGTELGSTGIWLAMLISNAFNMTLSWILYKSNLLKNIKLMLGPCIKLCKHFNKKSGAAN